MQRRTLIIVGSLEVLALALAQWQMDIGLRTDEAKYLLNIPYPHPPLLRWLMSLTEAVLFQEYMWRLIFASLLVQAVWLVWDMGRKLSFEKRATLCMAWLLSSAVLLQSGALMMSSATAVQALLFLWIRSRPEWTAQWPALVGLLWLGSLFTAFQAILFAPLVWDALRRAHIARRETAIYVLGPIALLFLHTLTNPLALATMVIHRNEGFRGSVSERLLGVARLWMIGGSGVIGAMATWEIFRGWKTDRALLLSFLLVCAFVTASLPFPFYAILFTPLFVAGVFAHLQERHIHERWSLPVLMIAGSIVVTLLSRSGGDGNHARTVMASIQPRASSGAIVIKGSFGHQWQYESPVNVRRYKPERTKEAQAVICLSACEPMFNTSGWKRLELSVETWVKK